MHKNKVTDLFSKIPITPYSLSTDQVMKNVENLPFIPVLTVMVDYGMSPFLWLVDSIDQGGVASNICDGTGWDPACLMSEGLWRKFADWAIDFDRTQFYSADFDANDWDWLEFHARGSELARWLKEEVGEAYRVIYLKPSEDPNHRMNERTEILLSSKFLQLPTFRGSNAESTCLFQHLIAGGQTGADRAALDFAIEHGYTHGGWAPHGRAAEDGKIPKKYQLFELEHGGYRQRTRRNVEDSDGTLIINLGGLDGGSLATKVFAQRSNKPYLIVQLDQWVTAEVATSIIEWVQHNEIKTLNVAGPRESKRLGIYSLARELLKKIDETW